MPRPSRPQQHFSAFRVFVAACVFACAVTTGIMTAFGSVTVLGPPAAERFNSLLSAVDAGTGEPIQATVIPATLGPGMLFVTDVTIPGGLEGYARIRLIEVKPQHKSWPGGRYPQYSKVAWPDMLQSQVPKPVTVRVEGTAVPPDAALIGATVSVLITLHGVRPMLEDKFLVDERFTNDILLELKLGRGILEPTGMLNFDLYNRHTTGMLAVIFLAVVAYILRPDNTPMLESPEDRMRKLERRR